MFSRCQIFLEGTTCFDLPFIRLMLRLLLHVNVDNWSNHLTYYESNHRLRFLIFMRCHQLRFLNILLLEIFILRGLFFMSYQYLLHEDSRLSDLELLPHIDLFISIFSHWLLLGDWCRVWWYLFLRSLLTFSFFDR